jgi:hypothetical protein
MFDEGHFPYQYECVACDNTASVAHEDVQDVPSYFAAFTVTEAVEYVMVRRREWFLGSMQGPLCPDCSDSDE